MWSRIWLGVVVGLLPHTVCPAATVQEPLPASSSHWVPEQAMACLEILRPSEVVESLLSPWALERYSALPALVEGRSTEGFQGLMGVVRYVELTVGTNWQGVVRTLTRDGMALAVGPGQRHLVVLDGGDAGMLQDLHGMVRQMAAGEAQKQGHPERVDALQVGEVQAWTFNGQEAHAVVEDRLLAASDAEVLRAALDLRLAGSGSLADRDAYRQARRAVGDDALAMVFLDLVRFREISSFSDRLQQQRRNPLAALVLPHLPEVLATAPWMAMGVYTEGGDLRARVYAGGRLGGMTAVPFSGEDGEEHPLVVQAPVKRQIASLSLNRDLAGFYAAKDDLFPQRTSGLIFFENMMGIFFSGRDFTDEVLASLQHNVQLVVARQEYDSSIGTPDPQIPAFALVLGLKDSSSFEEVLEEAWQKALGLVNFTRGQKAQPGLIMDRVPHQGIPMTVSAYSDRDVVDREHLPPRYNFRPTLALAHGSAILSSTDGLARDLMDSLAPGEERTLREVTGPHSTLTLNGRELQESLRANRDGMVRNSMIKEGKTQEEAEMGIDTLIHVVGWFSDGEVVLGEGEGGEWVSVALGFQDDQEDPKVRRAETSQR